MFSFYSDDSYEPMVTAPDPAKTKKKPLMVPSLNLGNLPEYESSSDEEDCGEGGQAKLMDEEAHKNMTTQDYEHSMKYIENFYNKCSIPQ